MKKFLKTYKSVIILLAAIIIGAIVGIAFKEKAAVLKPFGDIFLNLLFVVIVPLIFLSITTSIAKIKQPKRLGKIMITIFCVFIVMSLVSVLVGVLSTYSFKLVNTDDGAKIRDELEAQSGTAETTETEDLNILERTVNVLTVSDFNKLLSKENIIAIVVFSILFGIAIKMAGEKGEPLEEVLESAYTVMLKFVQLISYYSPIGLGCYFAVLVGTFGGQIALGYAKTFAIESGKPLPLPGTWRADPSRSLRICWGGTSAPFRNGSGARSALRWRIIWMYSILCTCRWGPMKCGSGISARHGGYQGLQHGEKAAGTGGLLPASGCTAGDRAGVLHPVR